MQYINLQILEVGPDRGERRVVVASPQATEFGVFDGYKDGTNDIARPATSEWMEGKTIRTALLATIDVEIHETDTNEHGILPNEADPTDYHDHQFIGTFRECVGGSEVLSPVCLYDGIDPGASGIPIATRERSFGVFSVDGADILINISDSNVSAEELHMSKDYRISATRTDVLGYVDT